MHNELGQVIGSLTVVVGAAALTALVFQALRLPVVLGYILTGLVIGPHVTRLVTDTTLIGTLSELGVILLFFTIGLEFSVRTIARVGVPTLLAVLLELGLVATIVFGAGRLIGWTRTEALFVALGVAIASTMLVVKGLEEHKVDPAARELILAMMVVEDLLSILLLAILTGVASGSGMAPGDLLRTIAKLGGFLAGMIVIGMLVVPRMIRYIARFERGDTLVVVSLATCFTFVWVALRAGYSVALGAFVAGTLIAESGRGHDVDKLVRPFRDAFAAVFFVSIGMSIVPLDVGQHWLAAVMVAIVLVLGKTFAVSVAAFLTGSRLARSIQAGLALSQIGELSFIAVGIGIGAGPGVVRSFLLPVVVGASCITAITGSWQIRDSERVAGFVVRGLPGGSARLVSSYESWIARFMNEERPDAVWRRVRVPLGIGRRVRAAGALLIGVLARQGREPAAGPTVDGRLPGLQAVPITLVSGSPAIGRSLAELDLRARSGASVIAMERGGSGAVNPSPQGALREGDVLLLTASPEAMVAAREILLGGP